MKKSAIVVCLGAALALAFGLSAGAQSAGFEVASVKPSNPNPTGPLGATPMMLPALGRVTAQNVTLRMLIVGVYQKQPFQIIGGPSWQNSEKFDINAVAENKAATPDQLIEMLRGLLADRFKLQVHTETREVPIYTLVVARSDGRLGEKIKPSADSCPDPKAQQQQMLEAIAKGGIQALAAMMPKPGESRPCSIAPMPTQGGVGFKASGQPISVLTAMLPQMLGRPVVDRTGLTGLYDFEFVLDMQSMMRAAADLGLPVPPLAPNLPDGPSIMTQLQENLGLKLDAGRGPGEVLVIDGAELPTPD